MEFQFIYIIKNLPKVNATVEHLHSSPKEERLKKHRCKNIIVYLTDALQPDLVLTQQVSSTHHWIAIGLCTSLVVSSFLVVEP